MNGHGISEYPAKTRKYGVFTLSFIIVIGMGFCYVDLFTDAGWKSKWYWLYTAVSVCGLSFFLTGAGRPETGKTFRIGLPDCLLAALVLYCLSRAAAGQFAEAFLMRCTAFLPIYCLAGRVVRNRSFEPLSAAVAASALLLALYGIAQYAGLLPAGKTFRVVGNFDNPAGYASMLALSVPFILYFALSGRRRMRYAVGVVCAIVVGAIVLSGSRTGILAVAATGLLYAVRRRSDFLRRTTAWKKIVLAATAVSVAAGLYFIKKESADGRLLIGRCTWEMIREKPLTGHGYRCFEAGYMLRHICKSCVKLAATAAYCFRVEADCLSAPDLRHAFKEASAYFLCRSFRPVGVPESDGKFGLLSECFPVIVDKCIYIHFLLFFRKDN